MKWATILKALKAKGYKGDDSLETVKAFVTEQNINLQSAEGAIDLDASFKAFKAVDVLIEDETPAETPAPMKKSKQQQADELRNWAGGLPNANNAEVTGGEPAFMRAYDEKVKRKGAAFSSAKNAALFMANLRTNLAENHSDAAKLYTPAVKAFDAQILAKAGISTNAGGGALVPMELSPDLIRLTEEYGVARRSTMMIPMQNEYISIPRQTGFTAGSWAGEATAPTTTEATFNNVQLVANTRALVVRASRELMNDAVLSYADIVSRDVARDFGSAEDDAFFNGDGTSTYGGFTGLAGKFRAVLEIGGGTWATDAGNLAGVVVAAGNSSDEGTYANLVSMWAKLPNYAKPGAAWYCSSYMYANYFLRLVGQPAASGLSWDYVTGAPIMTMFGKPVIEVQKMPAVEGNSQFNVYLGDLKLAGKFGEVTGSMEVTSSEHFYFTTREIAIRGSERVAINVHDVGNYSATAASRVAGPVIGLLSAAS